MQKCEGSIPIPIDMKFDVLPEINLTFNPIINIYVKSCNRCNRCKRCKKRSTK